MISPKARQIIESLHHLESKNESFLHLTANENIISETAREFLSSKLGGRYYLGGGDNGIVKSKAIEILGIKEVEELVKLAEKAVNNMLGSSFVSFNLLSGIHAMTSLILTISNPGDVVMTLNPNFSGHFLTRVILERIGRKQIVTQHGKKGDIDIQKTVSLFKEKKGGLLYLDGMSFIEKLPLKELKAGIGKNNIVIFDASHTLGLIMGKKYPNPFNDGADIITGNSHKTFPGPHKAIVAFKDKELGEKTMSVISRGLYSTVQTNNLIALTLTVLEMEKYGKSYADQIVANANKLGQEIESKSYSLRKTSDNKYTHNHQLHIFLDNIKDKESIMSNFYKNNISINIIGSLNEGPFIRLGTQEITRRGMKESDMKIIAGFFDKSINKKNIKTQIMKFNSRFKKIHYSFD